MFLSLAVWVVLHIFFIFLWASEDCSVKDLGMGTIEGPTTGKDEDWLCSPAVF